MDDWDWARYWELVLSYSSFPFHDLVLPRRAPQGHNASRWAVLSKESIIESLEIAHLLSIRHCRIMISWNSLKPPRSQSMFMIISLKMNILVYKVSCFSIQKSENRSRFWWREKSWLGNG